jgi:LCP family protein required for cell wall assembly
VLIICTGVSLYIIYQQITDDNASSLFENPKQTSAFAPAENVGSQNTDMPQVKTIEYNGKTYAKNEDIVNLLFLGVDYTKDRADLNLGYRADVVLVCAVDIASKKATLISLPRDLYTTMYEIDTGTGQITKTKQNRVNAAFAFGGGPRYYGYNNETACVEMFMQRECMLETPLDFTLDIPVYLYAGIDIDGIAPVADSIGGIEVTLEYSIPDVGKKGETILLKGKKAETYLRDRKHTPGGDIGRAKKEQDFMLRLAKKIKNMGAADIILSLWDDLQKYVDTGLNTTQMVDFAKILMSVDIDSIEKHTIPGEGTTTAPYYYIHDEEATLKLLLEVYYHEVP